MTAKERADNAVRDHYNLPLGFDDETLAMRLSTIVESAILAAEKEACQAGALEEREACAKIADSDFGSDIYMGGYSVQDIQKWAADRIAEAIRKRS